MSSKDDLPTFSSLEEEVDYWKTEAYRYKEITNEVQQELQEFRECSEDIEKELEAQLEQNEKQMKELKHQKANLVFECDALKERYEKLQSDNFKEISELQSNVARLEMANQEFSKDIRELEQQNDDLERTNRILMVSLDDFDQRLNQTMERNAFLESELDEKDSLSVTVQRLHDETRDLRHELAIRQQKAEQAKVNEKEKENTVTTTTTTTMTDEAMKVNKIEPPTTPVSKKPLSNGIHPSASTGGHLLPETPKISQKAFAYNGMDKTPLTPSARISALNIVGDLLRKVGALESKLASCRNFVYEQPGWHAKRTNSTSRSSESAQTPKTESANGRPGNLKLRMDMLVK